MRDKTGLFSHLMFHVSRLLLRSFGELETEQLTHRERLLRTSAASRGSQADFEFRAWTQTIDRWRNEGMDVPRLIGMGRQPEDLEPYFGTGDAEYDPRLNISVGLSPACDEIAVEDRGESWIIQGKV